MVLFIALTLGCKPPEEAPELLDVQTEGPGDPLGDHDSLPFPTDWWLVADATTPSGSRLALDPEAFPDALPVAELNSADGWSRVPPIVVHLPGGFRIEDLPADPEASLAQDAAVRLIDDQTGERVPFLAELDAGAEGDPDRQVLILRPHRTLAPATTHVVLLTDGLARADGGAHEASPVFAALRDEVLTSNDEVEAWRARFGAVGRAISGEDLAPASVILGWPFTTRSDEQVSGPLLAMHDAMETADLGDVAQTLTYEPDDDRLVVRGTFTVPWFLDADDRLVLEGGEPVQQGTRETPFTLSIPHVVDEARPVILFGHGFFAHRDEVTWSSLSNSLVAWESSAIAINFHGFNEDDQLVSFGRLGSGLSGLPPIVDQQRQSQAEFTALSRVVTEQLVDTVQKVREEGPYSPLNGNRVVYLGISNGGTQGLPILAASPRIDEASLVVNGGAWASMLQRAVQFGTLGTLLTEDFPDPVDLQVALSATQLLFDPVDGANFAPRVLNDRYPGRPPAKLTMHMAVGDAQVANLVTEWMARSAGVPLVTPSPREIWGLDAAAAGIDGEVGGAAGLFVYDEGFAPNPVGNVPPADDNGAHETIRYLPAYLAQQRAFLEEQLLVQVCDGSCDPN